MLETTDPQLCSHIITILETTDPQLCSHIITNVCKPAKKFDFPEVEQPPKFVWFKDFPWVSYS